MPYVWICYDVVSKWTSLLHISYAWQKAQDIGESVDSLRRDGTDTPIVRVHTKAFKTRERSRSKPFWALSYPIPTFFYPTIPAKWLKRIARLTARKRLNPRFVHLSSFSSSLIRDFVERPTSEVAEVLTVIFTPITFIPVCAVPFTNKFTVSFQILVNQP